MINCLRLIIDIRNQNMIALFNKNQTVDFTKDLYVLELK